MDRCDSMKLSSEYEDFRMYCNDAFVVLAANEQQDSFIGLQTLNSDPIELLDIVLDFICSSGIPNLVRLLIPLCISLAKKANIDSNELINRIKNRKQFLLQQPNIQTLR